MRAVTFILEAILPTEGPGLSARRRYMDEPSLLSGIKINTNTRSPMPPIQCEKLFQNSEEWESAVTSSTMLAPVVVNPDTISKKASI